MGTGYNEVQEALVKGADPAMLCMTCPWDRNCVTPPAMTYAQVSQQMKDAQARDKREKSATHTLIAIATIGSSHLTAMVCPVFALRLRSSAGRDLADTVKQGMQNWDEAS